MVRKSIIPCLVLLCLAVCAVGVRVKGAVGPVIGIAPQVEVAIGPVTAAVPWPYGLILYVDVEPEQTASAVAAATWAVESVCRLWEIPFPTLHADWNLAFDRVGCRGEETASAVPLFAQPRHAIRLPGLEESILRWWRCPNEWGERWPLEPVILMVVPDYDTVTRLVGNRPCRAFFSSCGFLTESYPASLPGPVIVMTQDDLLDHQGTLCHEVTHWLFQYDGERSLPGSFLPALREGSARLTQERLQGNDSYRVIAAIFAETGSLQEVPLSLVYPVGASVVEVLWGADLPQIWGTFAPGEWTQGFTRSVAQSIHLTHWRWLAYVIDDVWRESLVNIQPTAKDRVVYDAARARMATVAWMLDPILSDEAREFAARLCRGDVPEFRIDLFWELVGPSPDHLTPSQVERMAIRDSALAQIALENAIHVAPPAPEGKRPDYDLAQYLIARLVGLREMSVWPLYSEEFVRLVRLYVAEGAVEPDLIPWWDPDPAPPETD